MVSDFESVLPNALTVTVSLVPPALGVKTKINWPELLVTAAAPFLTATVPPLALLNVTGRPPNPRPLESTKLTVISVLEPAFTEALEPNVILVPVTSTVVVLTGAPGILAVTLMVRSEGSFPIPSVSLTRPVASVIRLPVTLKTPEFAESDTSTFGITLLFASRTSTLTITSVPAAPDDTKFPVLVVISTLGVPAATTFTVLVAGVLLPAEESNTAVKVMTLEVKSLPGVSCAITMPFESVLLGSAALLPPCVGTKISAPELEVNNTLAFVNTLLFGPRTNTPMMTLPEDCKVSLLVVIDKELVAATTVTCLVSERIEPEAAVTEITRKVESPAMLNLAVTIPEASVTPGIEPASVDVTNVIAPESVLRTMLAPGTAALFTSRANTVTVTSVPGTPEDGMVFELVVITRLATREVAVGGGWFGLMPGEPPPPPQATRMSVHNIEMR